MRYAYLGPSGTFTEAALRRLPDASDAECVPYASVPAALDAVRQGSATAAVVPVENSVRGVVPETLDELVHGDPALRLTAEVQLPVGFALLAPPGTELSHICRVRSHPHAHAQCRRWISERLPHAQVVFAASTADAAREVSETGSGTEAAIAAPVTAQTYRLAVLAVGLGAREDAVTRFLRCSERDGERPAPTGRDRTSLVLSPGGTSPSALVESLRAVTERGVGIAWLQPWPTGVELGSYHFFVDVDGHIEDTAVAEAATALMRRGVEVHLLGSYPRAAAPVPRRTAPPVLASRATQLGEVR